MIGTIFADERTLKRGDEHAFRQDIDRDREGRTKLAGLRSEVIGGEKRYFYGVDHYALVSRSMAIRWFRVEIDGDHSCGDPRKGEAS